jgi:hypothetical protein
LPEESIIGPDVSFISQTAAGTSAAWAAPLAKTSANPIEAINRTLFLIPIPLL